MNETDKYHVSQETFIKLNGKRWPVRVLIKKTGYDDMHQLFHVVYEAEIKGRRVKDWTNSCSGFGVEGIALDPIIPIVRKQLKEAVEDWMMRGYEVRNLRIVAGWTAGGIV